MKRYSFTADKADNAYKFIVFDDYAKHIAFLLYHFFNNEKYSNDVSYAALQKFMKEGGIRVIAYRDMNDKLKLRYADNCNFNVALAEDNICKEASYDFINEKTKYSITDDDVKTIFDAELLTATLVPEAGSPTNTSFFYKADAEQLSYNSNIVQQAFKTKAHNRFVGTKLIARKNYSDVKLSKTYRKLNDTEYSRENFSNSKFFKFAMFSEDTLIDYVKSAYKDGYATIHGLQTRLEKDVYDRRTKKAKVSYFANDFKDKISKNVKTAFLQYAPHLSAYIDEITLSTLTLPTVVSAYKNAFAIDIDKLNINTPDFANFDIIHNKERSLDMLRSKLPQQLRDVDCVVMLSSSFNMSKNDNNNYVVDTKQSEFSCRLWFASDANITSEMFKEYIIASDAEIDIDTSIYSSAQIIYGNPVFENCDDVFAEHRVFESKGKRKYFNVDEIENVIIANSERQIREQKEIKEKYMKVRNDNVEKHAFNKYRNNSANPLDDLEAKLGALGNRKEMRAISNCDTHFGFIRSVSYDYIFNVVKYKKDLDVFKTDIFAQEVKNDKLAFKLYTLADMIIAAFEDAIDDDNCVTTEEMAREYGIINSQIAHNSTIANLIMTAANEIIIKRKQYFNEKIAKEQAEELKRKL